MAAVTAARATEGPLDSQQMHRCLTSVNKKTAEHIYR